VQLVPKISKLCGRDPPTLQTERRTERRTDMQSQYLHYSALRGKKTILSYRRIYVYRDNLVRYVIARLKQDTH